MPSLADEIANLLNPAPREGDEEDDGFLTASERPTLMTEEERAVAAQVPSGCRMRAAIQMSEAEAARYAGRKVSRSDLAKRTTLSAPSADEDESFDEEDEEGEDEGSSGAEEGDEEMPTMGRDLLDMRSDDSDESGEEQEDGEGEEEEGEELSGEEGEEGYSDDDADESDGEEGEGRRARRRRSAEGGDSLYAEWSKLAEDEGALLAQLQASRSDETEAAKQAKQQRTM